MISQKGSNGDRKLWFFGRTIINLALFVQRYIFGQKLDKKGQNVRVKKLLWADENFFQNECTLSYWASIRLKMKQTEYTPALYKKA